MEFFLRSLEFRDCYVFNGTDLGAYLTLGIKSEELMSTLDPVEEVRLQNLKVLHGASANFGAPTSGGFSSYLSSRKVSISQPELSNLYHRKTPIDHSTAQKIERGLGLPDGWLSHDQSFWLGVSPKDAAAIKAFTQLPAALRGHLAEVITALGEVHVQQAVQGPTSPPSEGT